MPVSSNSNSGSRLPRRTILLDQPVVGKRPLRILVEHLQIGMRRRGIEVVVQLLDVLAMISLGIGQAKQPLLENRIAAVPQGQRQTEMLLIVADARQAVLAPAIGAAAGLFVGEVFPGIGRRRCNPRAQCPIAARSDKRPICATAAGRGGPLPDAVSRQ